MKKTSKKEIIWKVSYEVLNCYLDFYRKENHKYKAAKSWETMKWELRGNVAISKLALERFIADDRLTIKSKAKDRDGASTNGNQNCFVAEHPVPLSVLQDKFYSLYAKRNPTYEEFKTYFLEFNKICYVWHEEDTAINEKGYKSSVPNFDTLQESIYARYYEVGIKPIETNHQKGHKLFIDLAQQRDRGANLKEIIKNFDKS